jgi:hypothetical protein
VKLVPPWYWKSSSTPTTIVIQRSFHSIPFHAWPLCHCPPHLLPPETHAYPSTQMLNIIKYCKWAKISTQWAVLWRSPNFTFDEKESTMASSWHWWWHWTFCGENLQA